MIVNSFLDHLFEIKAPKQNKKKIGTKNIEILVQ